MDGWAILSAIATAVAAGAAWWAAHATEKATKGQLASTLIAEYAEHQMLEDLQQLGTWHRDGVAKGDWDHRLAEWKKHRSQSNHHDHDAARRRVKFFYFRAEWLYREGALSRASKKRIGELDGLGVLYDVVLPMELAIQEDNPRGRDEVDVEFTRYRKLWPRPAHLLPAPPKLPVLPPD